MEKNSRKNAIFNTFPLNFFHFFRFFQFLRIILKPDVGILHRKIVNFENKIFSCLLFKKGNEHFLISLYFFTLFSNFSPIFLDFFYIFLHIFLIFVKIFDYFLEFFYIYFTFFNAFWFSF